MYVDAVECGLQKGAANMREIEIVKEAVKTAIFIYLLVIVIQTNIAFDRYDKKLTQTINDADTLIVEARSDLHDTRQDLASDLISIGITSDIVQDAARKQSEYWDRTGKETAEATSQLEGMLAELREETIPRVQFDLDTLTEQTLMSEKSVAANVNATQKGLAPAVDDLARSARAIRERLEDPSVAEAQRNLDEATRNVAMTTHDVQEYVHRVTRPVSFVKRLLWGGADTALKGAQFYGATQ